MPRKRTIYSDSYPYHIYNRSNNKEQFPIDLETLWEICEVQLRHIHRDYRCEIIAFVLMPNHYHMMIQTPAANISEAMQVFHRNIAKEANAKAFRINHFFGTRYKWSLINKELYLLNCFKYVLRNPVKAALSKQVEDYKFSTAFKKADYISNLYSDILPSLDWLNESFSPEAEEVISLGLRRREFKPGKSRTGYPARLTAPLR